MVSADVVNAALTDACAAWTGCDWDTETGARRANLKGLRSRQAKLAAQATRGEESAFWREAHQYLEKVEQDSRAAATLAKQAVEAWHSGDYQASVNQIDRAIELEARYRQPIAYPKLRDLLTQTIAC